MEVENSWTITRLLKFALIVSLICMSSAVLADNEQSGKYSTAAVMGWPVSAGGQGQTIPSPNGRVVVQSKGQGDDTHWYLEVSGNSQAINTDAWPYPEFLWSSDSNALAVTYSDGGSVGNFHVTIYLLTSHNTEIIDFAPAVQKEFLTHYPKCFDPETPNIAAVSWLNGSQRLLMAAEVLPDSNCDDMGTFALYEVSVPKGDIIKKYGQIEAKRQFRNVLGAELKNADDDCILKPGTCYVPQLHNK
jgi:hypothetical protein